MSKTIGIIDEALRPGATDNLDISIHSQALIEFIENCELPTEMAIFQLHAFKENLTNKEHSTIKTQKAFLHHLGKVT